MNCLRGEMKRKKPSRTTLHGVLLDVLGVGVLIVGPSGIGKTECALELIAHGHRLVADDLIEVEKGEDGTITGFSHEVGRHHMEIRGLGIIDIERLFGKEAIAERKPIELVIELAKQGASIPDRVGLESRSLAILGQQVPSRFIPVGPNRNLATIVEVAVKDYLLKKKGVHVAREFERKISKGLARQ